MARKRVFLAGDLSELGVVDDGFEDEVIARVDAQRALRRAMGHLTPAERRAVYDLLYDRPTYGDADRQRRSRATKKLREILSQNLRPDAY